MGLPAPRRLETPVAGSKAAAAQPGPLGQSFGKPEPQKLARAEIQPLPQAKASMQPLAARPSPLRRRKSRTIPPACRARAARISAGGARPGHLGFRQRRQRRHQHRRARTRWSRPPHPAPSPIGQRGEGLRNLVLIRHYTATSRPTPITTRSASSAATRSSAAKWWPSPARAAVTSPQLHFEFRKGSSPVDPIPFLENYDSLPFSVREHRAGFEVPGADLIRLALRVSPVPLPEEMWNQPSVFPSPPARPVCIARWCGRSASRASSPIPAARRGPCRGLGRA